ncbi:MAG: ATPase [Treponema sp. CETP13]|nr:MAG: ATPase [Treponema sp. CETP13]
MNRRKLVVTVVLLIACVASVFAQEADAAAAESMIGVAKYIASALAVGLACIAGGMAVGKIGAAAMGAMSENPDLSGKALPYVGLAEGICLWGFLVSLLIILL